jgi:hypothetical protein
MPHHAVRNQHIEETVILEQQIKSTTGLCLQKLFCVISSRLENETFVLGLQYKEKMYWCKFGTTLKLISGSISGLIEKFRP